MITARWLAKGANRGNGPLMPKKIVAFVIAITILAAFMVPNVKATNEISIDAIANSYVDSASPATNFGNSIFLYSHDYNVSVAEASAGLNSTNLIGPLANTWLKFDLSQIPPQAIVSSIVLRMHTAVWGTRSHNQVGVFVSEDVSWTETGITWNNAQFPGSNIPIQVVNVNDPDVNYEFNLTSALTGRSMISLILESVQSAKEPAVFNSRNLNNGPTLIVDYNMPTNIFFIESAGVGAAVITAILVVIFFWRRKKTNSLTKQSS